MHVDELPLAGLGKEQYQRIEFLELWMDDELSVLMALITTAELLYPQVRGWEDAVRIMSLAVAQGHTSSALAPGYHGDTGA